MQEDDLMPFRFADSYREAGLSPGAEIVNLRQAAFEKLSPSVDFWRCADLVRILYGLPTESTCEWFREGFAENDSSFSLVENAREVSTLAGCLLMADMENDWLPASLMTLCASVSGQRLPAVLPNVLTKAREAFHRGALTESQSIVEHLTDLEESTFLAPLESPQPDAARALQALRGPLSELIKRVNRIGHRATVLQRDSNILWWFISGWSRFLDSPLEKLPRGCAVCLAGIELASFCDDEVGPAASRAILYRILERVDGGPQQELCIRDAADAFTQEQIRQLELSKHVGDLADLCPMSFCLWKAEDVGAGIAWHDAFRRKTKLSEAQGMDAVSLAYQAYLETLLLAVAKRESNEP